MIHPVPTMKSPFPGMDPYLEAHWRDMHQSLVIYSRDELQAQLPGDLRARVEERVYVESPLGRERSVYPDVRVLKSTGIPSPSLPGRVDVAEPLLVEVGDEPVTEGYVEIRETGTGGRVVTVLEFISLPNKQPGEGRRLYRRKQRELRAGAVSLVEIDLLRAGRRVLAIPEQSVPPSHRTPYRICVLRAWQPSWCELYAAPLRQRLPGIRIPLRETDEDARLDLQALVAKSYENGAYDDIDYSVEPDPPLPPDDASWADSLLREKGVRR